jgi:hypothetical protein
MPIKEDMRGCDEEARRILQESTRLGETLHEDARRVLSKSKALSSQIRLGCRTSFGESLKARAPYLYVSFTVLDFSGFVIP